MKHNPPELLTFISSRAEAMRLAPAVRAIQASGRFRSTLCTTFHPRDNFDQILHCHGLQADVTIRIPADEEDQDQAALLAELRKCIRQQRADLLLLNGGFPLPTEAALIAAELGTTICQLYPHLRADIDLTHTYFSHLWQTAALADLHLLPDEASERLLQAHGPAQCSHHVIGSLANEALDCARELLGEDDELRQDLERRLPFLPPDKKVLLVSGLFSDDPQPQLQSLRDTLCGVLDAGWEVVFPVEWQPEIQEAIYQALPWHERLHLLEPMDFLSYTCLFERADAFISDAPTAQEVATARGTPLFAANCNAHDILTGQAAPTPAPAVNPPSSRLVDVLADYLQVDRNVSASTG